MDYEKRIKTELQNDPVWRALSEKLKPEERTETEAVIGEFIRAAGKALYDFSLSTSESQITMEEIETAIKDRTGRRA